MIRAICRGPNFDHANAISAIPRITHRIYSALEAETRALQRARSIRQLSAPFVVSNFKESRTARNGKPMNKPALKLAARTAATTHGQQKESHAIDPRLAHRQSTSWRSQFRDDVLNGLESTPRKLSSLYFYDDQGSALFDKITRLPEYYLTRSEQAILHAHARDIAVLVANEPVCVVDLGAGSGEKTRCLIQALLAQGTDVTYAPLDVSDGALRSAEQSIRTQFPSLKIELVQGEYVPGLARIRKAQAGKKLLVLWLGSSIGNLTDQDATALLQDLANECTAQDVMLIGFDLLKDPKMLVAAYDDAQGVTAEFNFNLLRRINRELDGNIDVDAFSHYATFNPLQSRMESYLISRKAQSVTVAGHTFELDAWEPIHTEISCKYSRERIASIVRQAGLKSLAAYVDAGGTFLDIACVRRPALSSKNLL